MPVTTGFPIDLNYRPQWELEDLENNPEHQLFNSMICEFTDISGFSVIYYVSKANMDELWGEDPNNDYEEGSITKLIYEPTEETTILNAFGITSDETLQFAMIPRDTFTRDVSGAFLSAAPSGTDVATVNVEPMAGDVIKTVWNDRKYEVVDVGKEAKIFQAKKMVWELILRPYRFSEQSEQAEEIYLGINTEDDYNHDQTSWTEAPSADTKPPTKPYAEGTYGDNTWAEETSDSVDNYKDVDTGVFGF